MFPLFNFCIKVFARIESFKLGDVLILPLPRNSGSWRTMELNTVEQKLLVISYISYTQEVEVGNCIRCYYVTDIGVVVIALW